MKKVQSIGFKLVAGGIFVVLVPLLIVGGLSMTKASNALTTLSKAQARDVAADLARLTNQILLAADITLAKTFAAKRLVVRAATLKHQGNEGELPQALSDLFENLKSTFNGVDKHYEGFFLTDVKGNVITGVLEDGKHYPSLNVGEGDYFKEMISTGDASIGEMIRSRVSDKLICVISTPVKTEGGEFAGSFCLVIKAHQFTELVSGRKIGSTGYGFMVNKNGAIIAHPVEKHILSLNMFKIKDLVSFAEKMVSGSSGVDEYTFNGVEKVSGYAPVGLNDWYIASTQDSSEFLAAVHSMRNSSLIVGTISLVLTVAMVLLLSRSMVRPLNDAVAGLKDIAEGEGDLTMRLAVTSRDEIGELATWFNLFMGKLQQIIKNIGENSKLVEESSTELSAIAVQISSGAESTASRSSSVAAAAEEMSANLHSVAAAMEQSSTNTSMVAAAAEEMSSTINEIAKNAEQARSVAVKAVEKSRSASMRMSELGKTAQAIGKVTETITDISEQTNLLALNATIEAARAGEAGKGFAVVANEIKDLATKTARATLDIRTQIEEVQNSTSLSLAEIDEISNVINGVSDIVATIAAAVEEQSTATREISTNINQASQGIQEVNENISQSSSVAEEITRDIAQVNLAAGELSNESEQVRLSAEKLNSMSAEITGIVSKFKV